MPAEGESVNILSPPPPQRRNNQAVTTTFEGDPRWEGWTPGVTEAWGSMVPTYRLMREQSFNEGAPHGIAMFHQIHCLIHIREHFSSFLEVNGTTDQDRARAKSDGIRDHMSHCFNWLRQALLCYADDTKELIQADGNGSFLDLTKHECASSEALYDLANGYYSRENSGELLWHDRPRTSSPT